MTFAIAFFVLSWLLILHFMVTRLLSQPSITLLLLGALLVVHGAPMLIYLYVTGPDTFIYEAALLPVVQEDVFDRVLYAMGIAFLGVAAGVVVAQKAWSFCNNESKQLVGTSKRELRSIYKASFFVRTIAWLAILGMLSVILLEGQLQKIVEFYMSNGSEVEKIALRTQGGGTGIYAYNVFLYSVAPFIVMVLWCLKRSNNDDWHLKVLLASFFAVVLIGKLGTLSKAPAVIFLIQLAFLSTMFKRASIRFKDVALLLLVAVVLFGLVVNYTIPGLDLEGIFKFLYYRVFDIPNESLIEFFSAFPHSLPHNWHYGIFGNLNWPLGIAPLANYYTVAELTRGSLLSTTNVMFLGDTWGDYEWFGVITLPFLVGLVVQFVDLYAARNGRTDEWACITAGCLFSVFTLLSTAFSTALITGGLALIPIASMVFPKKKIIQQKTNVKNFENISQ